MRTYLYCEAGFVEKAQWLPNSWDNVVCPDSSDFKFLTETLKVPESFLMTLPIPTNVRVRKRKATGC